MTKTDREARTIFSPRDNAGRERSVSICAWCPQLHILRLDRNALDVVMIVQEGSHLSIFRNGDSLEITHGMCPNCYEKERAEGRVCEWCREGFTPVVSSADPTGKQFVHPDTPVGRVLCRNPR
jgi:hypothetical protein